MAVSLLESSYSAFPNRNGARGDVQYLGDQDLPCHLPEQVCAATGPPELLPAVCLVSGWKLTLYLRDVFHQTSSTTFGY